MKCIVKHKNGQSEMSADQALEKLEPGMTVDCYNDKGELEGTFGCVTHPPEIEKPTTSIKCSLLGPIGFFDEIQGACYVEGLNIRVDSKEQIKVGFLIRATKERVLFSITGSADQISNIKRQISEIKTKWGID